jgi:DNA polymerase (family 10)
MSTNMELANMFQMIATILEIKGESGFKVNANIKVARVLEELVEDIRSIDDPTSIDGIGKSSAKKIQQFIETGVVPEFNELADSIPSGLLDVMRVQGLGPKTVGRLWKEAEVVDLSTLREAIDDGRLESLPRMGRKTIDNISDALAFLESSAGRKRIGKAMPIAEAIIALLRAIEGVLQIEFAGSLRRGKETIGDIDILASTDEPVLLADSFCSMSNVTKILAQGQTKCSVRIDAGMQVDLRIVENSAFGAAMLYFTGSKEHNVALRERAIQQGKRLNEYGLFEDDGDETPPQQRGVDPIARSEEEIYAALKSPWIPAELREDRGELDDKDLGNFITEKDIKCDLHCHTIASDGHMTIEELAMYAIARGYHTIAVTDHSQSSAQANGLKPDRLRKHIDAIHEVNEALKEITILAGSEVDILTNGELDYDDELLALLDIVVASPHVSLHQSSSDATTRLLKAIEHPLVHIIGHPTGRIINKRRGLEPNMQTLIDAAVATNTALELNANSLRLDLRDTHVKAAVEAGAMISVNTDAHVPEHFDQLRYGIGTARRGWLTPAGCINCFSHEDLTAWLDRA